MSKLRKDAAAYAALLAAVENATSLEELRSGLVAPKPDLWEPLYVTEVGYPAETTLRSVARQNGLDLDSLRAAAAEMVVARSAFTNRKYLVLAEAQAGTNTGWVHLSVTRHDGRPVDSWDDLQRIKNEVVGDGCEGVELYPAEARRMDSGNVSHLWVSLDPADRFHIGFHADA